VEITLTIALMLPLAPLLYRIAFRPIADAPVLVLLIGRWCCISRSPASR
jgi:hypothetical protein